VQRLGLSLALITLAVILLIYSRVPDNRMRGNVSQQSLSPGAQPSPSMGLLFGSVTTVVPPTPGAGEGRVPGPIPGGSSAPVVAASVGVAPVGSSHIWWAMTDVEGNFAIAVPPGTYLVTMEARPGMGMARNLPATVTVESDQKTRLDIHLDTGLR
jgi:carboxypeptidase family protein